MNISFVDSVAFLAATFFLFAICVLPVRLLLLAVRARWERNAPPERDAPLDETWTAW
jgi:hypothetical protein